MKGTDTCAESVLKLSDTENSDKKKPRDIYIFCKDETGLFSELDSKLFVPLIPEWEEYFIRELKGRKILKMLNVYSSVTFAAYKITLKDGEKEIVKVLTDGLKSGEICIPGAKITIPRLRRYIPLLSILKASVRMWRVKSSQPLFPYLTQQMRIYAKS